MGQSIFLTCYRHQWYRRGTGMADPHTVKEFRDGTININFEIHIHSCHKFSFEVCVISGESRMLRRVNLITLQVITWSSFEGRTSMKFESTGKLNTQFYENSGKACKKHCGTGRSFSRWEFNNTKRLYSLFPLYEGKTKHMCYWTLPRLLDWTFVHICYLKYRLKLLR